MSRKIVDSNLLQNALLEEYLAGSKEHFAVLTDYLMMELYNGAGPEHIGVTMEILSGYPEQVIALQSTNVVRQLSGRAAGLQRRMIDRDATRDFAALCKAIERAKHDPRVAAGVEEKRQAAAAHFQVVRNDLVDYNEILDGIAADYPVNDLRAFRAGEPLTEAMWAVLSRNVARTAGILFRANWNRRWPQLHELPNTFMYRYALACHVAALFALQVGRRANPAQVQNNMVDATMATYATYFDGLLTQDHEAMALYLVMRRYLDNVPPVPNELAQARPQ